MDFKFAFLLIIFLICQVYTQFNYLNLTISNSPSVATSDQNIILNDKDLQNEISVLNIAQLKSRTAACLGLVRNAFAKGDERIHNALKEAKTDLSKTYDKIVILMLENCEKNIKQDQAIKFLTTQNILSTDESYMSLLNFSTDLFKNADQEIIFKEEDKLILKELNNVVAEDEEEKELQIIEEKQKIEKIKFFAIGAASLLILFIFAKFVRNFMAGKESTQKLN